MTLKVRVNAKSHAYDILLGDGAVGHLKAELERLKPSSVLIVTNCTVAPLYLEQVRRLGEAVAPTFSLILPDGEQFKDFDSVSMILERLCSVGADRKSVLLALGGGVVGDLAGFAAAIYMRGIRFIQIPTTLLAIVDSSVGGKTGMNLRSGKNLVGAFHQPEAVIADTSFLKTLPSREVSAGIGEIIKHGLLADRDYFERLEKDMEKLIALDAHTLAEIVADSCRIKASVVSRDETEKGERAKLNLGHTFGHAIEKLTGFGTWLHGEAVGCGLVLAARASEKLGLLKSADTARVRALVKRAGLPDKIPGLSAQAALDAMKGDKKSTGGVPKFILLNSLGNSFVTEVLEEVIRETLLEEGYIP